MEIIACLPPEILQSFRANLLSTPTCKFREDSECLERVYKYIKNKLVKRCRNNQIRKAKCEKLEIEFLELYERIKKKEEDHQATKKHHTQRLFYSLPSISRKNEEIFGRIKYRK